MIDILAISPLERPDVRLVGALRAAGVAAVLDLGRDARAGRRALAAVGVGVSVRVPEATAWADADLPAWVRRVVVADARRVGDFGGREVIAEVRSVDEARAAVAAGAVGVIGRGAEGGGRVGPENSFVLAQRLAAADLGVPWWIAGGIGPRSAAACAVAGGGVVLDVQLALAEESGLSLRVQRLLRAMDGGETAVVGGLRVLVRPDLASARGGWTEAAAWAALGAEDPTRQLVPVGQDGALAAGLAAEGRTAAGIVAAVRRGAEACLAAAADAEALREGGPLAGVMGTRWPIAQGPMTRVSDVPGFAAAVAEGGALPFVALSLLRADAARGLLEQTAAACGGLPWGAGILGFAPPDVRGPQLALLAEVRPPFALIAGGRPSQARELEAQGTPAFLHCPSPALLSAFLADGARRFVFEGSECGGHVGPRSSFVLWEQAMALLEAGPGCDVLLAGGIHDARSAAMAAAMAGRASAAGSRVGVLMGTAYLFTEEAVTTGAVLPGFQRAALEAERTVLLETAPGHATRAADSPFVAEFEAERRRLVAAGLEGKEVWARLEQLNVGRLRVASKGIVREGDSLVEVGADTQAAEGLFMLGQVAALRGSVTTIAALHDEVAAGGASVLSAFVTETADDAAAPVAVAIVGMAAILPDAPDLDTYWAHILADHDAVREVPAERFPVDRFYAADGPPGETTPSKWGGFLPPVRFEPLRYGIPPNSLVAIDPAQLLALEVSRRALADAGYEDRPFPRARTSVIFGTESGGDLGGGYAFRASWRHLVGEIPPELDAVLPKLTEDSFPGVLGNVLAGRVANRLDLGGVNYTVDAACASSLAAVDLAAKELAAGSSDMVICGGADLHNGLQDYLLFSATHALSPSGRCRTFDAAADGIVLGEGVAAVVLKRLDDARRDGDRIYAVLHAVAGSSDGRHLGLTAPRQEGQERAVQRAWARSGQDRSAVGLIEAHGTGTVVGDRTELRTLEGCFGGARDVLVGSVKSQIGHTKCTAGIAGLMKAALAVAYGVRPGMAKVASPNPAWRPGSALHFASRARPWPSSHRLAGVSAFGFGGTNFHAVLSSADARPRPPRTRPAELFLLRGDAARIGRTLELLLARLDDPTPPPLGALAKAVCAAGDGPVGVAIVASDAASLRAAISAARGGVAVDGAVWIGGKAGGPVAFLFPGQGSQRPDMLADLFVQAPWVQRWLADAPDLVAAVYPPDAYDDAARAMQREAVTDTRVAQPALGLVSLAAAELLEACGVRAEFAGGHSYGELAALCWAGAIDEADLLGLSRARAEAIVDTLGDDPGAMAAVRAAPEAVAPVIAACPDVQVVNHNAPRQVVIAGPTASVQAAVRALNDAQIVAQAIPVAAAFHSRLVAGASDRFAEALRGVALSAPAVPVWSNVTGRPHDAASIAEALSAQVASPVRFVDQIRDMVAAGARVFVEVGPGRVLSGLVRKIVPDATVVSLDAPGEPGWAAFLGALAALATAGVPVDPSVLFAERELAEVDLSRAVPAPVGAWWVDGHRARPVIGEPPPGGLVPVVEPLGLSFGGPTEPHQDAVLAYLENMRRLAEAQRDVMLGLVGAPVVVSAPERSTAERSTAKPAKAPAPIPEARDDGAPPALSPLDALLDVVSERTGYPRDMLDPDLDLEADLSIDSIKRIEVLSLLGDRLGGVKLGDDALEALAAQRTLRGIVNWLAGASSSASSDGAAAAKVDAGAEVGRWRVQEVAAPARGGLLPAEVVVLGAEAEAAVSALVAAGVAAKVVSVAEAAGQEVVLHTAGAGPVALFPDLRLLLEGGVRRVLVVDDGLSGVDGLVRTAAREYPDRIVRAVQGPVDAWVSELAEDGPVVVRVTGGVRHAAELVAEPLTGDARALPIGAGDVVLVTGGARGITAHVVAALAAEVPATFVLVGRSPLPDGEEAADTAGITDEPSLRRALIARGVGGPAAVESALRSLLAARELRDNLARIAATGAVVDYRVCDVRDAVALTALIEAVKAQHGPVRGVIHAAGVLDDKRMKDKDPVAYARVYDTKVGPADVLLSACADAAFIVLFGSISGVVGNRGQADYAAANAALDARARAWKGSARVLSMDWGPWGGAGMVSDALARAYAGRGIGLLSLEDGSRAVIDELRRGDAAQVIWQAGDPRAFAHG